MVAAVEGGARGAGALRDDWAACMLSSPSVCTRQCMQSDADASAARAGQFVVWRDGLQGGLRLCHEMHSGRCGRYFWSLFDGHLSHAGLLVK
jgi:hypothetical protein